MSVISLRKLVSKKDLALIVDEIAHISAAPVCIKGPDNVKIFGPDVPDASEKHPVKLGPEVIGWVSGGGGAALTASLLGYLAGRDSQKRALASDTLEKYKELTMLYDISEKMALCLDLKGISKLVMEEAYRFIKGTGASVMMLNGETGQLDTVVTAGKEYYRKESISRGEGITGDIFMTGRAEIVNDVRSDPRHAEGVEDVMSMICAPITIKTGVAGVIAIGSEDPVAYSSGDLKLLSTLAAQASFAIENAVFHENRLREERIKSNLERYIAPQVVKAIIESRDDIPLAPTKKNMTILFSDIRNFSSVCEELPPEKVVEYLNEYFTHMVDIVFAHGGTLNKLVGDMIVALFGAPATYEDNECRAIRTAIDMQRLMKAFPTKFIRDRFSTGIGINSGDVLVGNVGSPRHMDYTAIGDEVNIAQRLESIAKGGQILVTRSIYEAARHMFEFEKFDNVTVKGRKNALEVYGVKY